jgi:hypothetical protein
VVAVAGVIVPMVFMAVVVVVIGRFGSGVVRVR